MLSSDAGGLPYEAWAWLISDAASAQRRRTSVEPAVLKLSEWWRPELLALPSLHNGITWEHIA
jgi:hypothetical protein